METIIWKNARHHRIAITIDDSRVDAAGQKELFDGYSAVVGGGECAVAARCFTLDNMRAWMAELADNAVERAMAMVAANV